jgi:hypothetical protein
MNYMGRMYLLPLLSPLVVMVGESFNPMLHMGRETGEYSSVTLMIELGSGRGLETKGENFWLSLGQSYTKAEKKNVLLVLWIFGRMCSKL